MTAPFTKIAPDALTRFQQGDEATLERIFRDEYDTLLSLAAAESGDPSSAPRLVEAAFYEAWQKRTTFTSPGDLEYFIRRAIHQGALREQGRRAALHRFAEHEGVGGRAAAPNGSAPIGADEAWSQLAAVLHAPPPDAGRAASVRRDHSRHETAEHVKHIADSKTSMGTILLMLGVAAAVVLALVFVIPRLSPGDPAADADAALRNNDTRVVSTQPGLRANVELADGSRATLGPDSRLRIPPGFGTRSRALGLEGTARIDVAQGGDRTLVVRAGPATVTATGTAFEVSSWPGLPAVVRVTEGRVNVIAGGASRALSEGQAIGVDSLGTMATPSAAELEEALGWAEGTFVVNGRTMREMPDLLRRWYGLDVEVADSSVLDRELSFRVPMDSTRQLIATIEQLGRVRYASRGASRVFRDADAEAAAPAARSPR